MIQKRWVKEAKEKANNVWDTIREIPDLDDDLRYEEMTLVHCLGMKSGFVNISITSSLFHYIFKFIIHVVVYEFDILINIFDLLYFLVSSSTSTRPHEH